MKSASVIRETGVMAALHRAGTGYRGVIGKVSGDGVQIIDSRSFDAAQAGRIESWLASQSVGRVVCVLPASSVICRTMTMPDAPREQLLPALALQAESHLLGAAPPHRVGMAIIDPAPGETSRAGLVLAWPESASPPELPTGVGEQYDVTYVPDVACLAAVMNGERLEEPLVWLDRGDGSVAMAISHSQGVTYRAAAESGNTDQQFAANTGRVLAETALNVGHTADYAKSMASWAASRLNGTSPQQGILLIPQQLAASTSRRIKGARDEPQWWATFGVATGALLATREPLAPLTQLREEPIAEHPSIAARAGRAMSTPRVALRLAIVAAIVLLFSPLLFAGMRRALFAMQVGDMNQFVQSSAQGKQLRAMYAALQQDAWPMSKLLAEITGAAPVGVQLESVALNHGRGFTIRGETDNEELIFEMLQNYADSPVFQEIVLGQVHPNQAGKHAFDVSGEIDLPFDRTSDFPDYAAFTLSERLYGRDEEPEPAGENQLAASQTDEETPGNDAGAGQPSADETESRESPGPVTAEAPTGAIDEQGRQGRDAPRVRPQPRPRAEREEDDFKILETEEIEELNREDTVRTLAETIRRGRRTGLTEKDREDLQQQQDALRKHLDELGRGG